MRMVGDWILRMRASSFVRNASTVFVGTALAQVAPLAAAPLLSRLYTPAEFGVFGVFLSFATFMSVLFSGRMNVAVLLPAEDEDAAPLLAVGFVLAVVLASLTLMLSLGLGEGLISLIGEPELGPYLPWTVVAGFLLAAYALGYAWLNRTSQFRRMAVSRVIQSTGITGAQIGAGAAGLGTFGLVGGLMVGQVVGSWLPLSSSRRPLQGATVASMQGQLRRYRRFPLVSLPADLINSASNQLPIVLLATAFGASTVGLYNLTLRVVAAPAQLLSTAVLDAFRQRAAADFARTGSCRAIFTRTLFILAVLASPPAIILGLWGPDLFAFIFGEEWRTAGTFARLLIPWFFLGFIASPLGYTLYIAERQGTDLAWQSVLFVVVNGSILLGAALGGPAWAIGLFGASYAAMYLIYIALSYHAAGNGPPNRPITLT